MNRIDGVSENLWSAEGVLGGMEALSLYDSPDTARQRKNYQGDLEATTVIGQDDGDNDEETRENNYSDPNKTPRPSRSDLPTPENTPPNRYNTLEGEQPTKRTRYNSYSADRNQRFLRESPGLEQALTEPVD